VQRNVVIEEFKQRYLNQPYGDVWLLLRPLAYQVHPYRWATIGKEISHIEQATMEDVKGFFRKHYTPSNAVLVVAGNVEAGEVKRLAEKWFAPIPAGARPLRTLPAEPAQTEARRLTVERDVPASSIYKVYHMCSRLDDAYHTVDLLSDVLSRGNSSRMYKSLVKEKTLFSEINAYVMGDIDKGLFVISGKLPDGVSMEAAEAGILEEIRRISTTLVDERELQKCKNKVESTLTFSETDVLTKATNLAVSELLGDAALINREVEKYAAVTAENIRDQARTVLREENCSTLYYLAKK
jgi:predicted Zn-dependent peptidase